MTIAAFQDGTWDSEDDGQLRERIRIVPGLRLEGTRYRVLRLLGEGGMGSVYEAEHIDIGRHVALKVLHHEHCRRPGMVEMFREEARAASKIGSRYIIDVFDFGELADGRVLFAMELLGATTLADLDREVPMEPGRLLGILRQVCKGLGAAHRAGIVHRDVKPENILLYTREGRRDSVKIVDFGIALVRGEHAPGAHRPMGTPEYMAPEQVTGVETDGRADVYALACTAYAVLAGRPPFQSRGVVELLAMQVSDVPPPLRSLRPDCPEALEAVVMRALAKDPDDRYRDMDDFEAALCEAQVEAGLTTYWDDLSLPDVDAERRDRLLRAMPEPFSPARAKAGPWAWVAGAALLVGAAGGYLALRPEPEVAAAVERDRTVELLVDAARTAGARAYYVYPPADDRDLRTAYQSLIALEEVEGPLEDEAHAAAGELRQEFASTLERLGDAYWDKEGGRPFAIDYYIQAAMFGSRAPNVVERAPFTPGELADLRQRARAGEFHEAELIAAETLQVLAFVDTEAEPKAKREKLAELSRRHRKRRSTTAQSSLDELLVAEGVEVAAAEPVEAEADPAAAPAEEDLERALEQALENAPEPEATPDVPAAPASADGKPQTKRQPDRKHSAELTKQAGKAHRGGDTKQAMALLNQALDAQPNNARALILLSDIRFNQGEYRSAIRLARRAVDVRPKNADFRIKLGDAYYKQLRYSEALSEYERASDLGHRLASHKIEKVKRQLGR
jgi:tetratricopeptide (TPR) repeat protein